MKEYSFSGTHIICDVSEIDQQVISNNALILDSIRQGIADSGATLCGMQTKEFEPMGVAAIYILSESHVSVHTYPERGSLFFDVFTCGDHCAPQKIVDSLLRALGPCAHRTSVVGRGLPVSSVAPVGVHT